MSDSEAVEALWNAIFKAVKVVDDDPLTAWQEHRKSFEARVAYLNKLNLNTLTYTNSLGTNLTVTLNEGYLFAGGGSYTTKGQYFFQICQPRRFLQVHIVMGLMGLCIVLCH